MNRQGGVQLPPPLPIVPLNVLVGCHVSRQICCRRHFGCSLTSLETQMESTSSNSPQ